MKAKEKAVELLDKFKDHVNPYIGSGMLSNTHDDSAILFQSKQCALIVVDEILNTGTLLDENMALISACNEFQMLEFWQQVRTEIESL